MSSFIPLESIHPNGSDCMVMWKSLASCIEQHLKVSSAYFKLNASTRVDQANKLICLLKHLRWLSLKEESERYNLYTCQTFLCRTFKVFVFYICSGWFLPPGLIDWKIYKYFKVTWASVALMAYMAYYLLNHKTVYHSSSSFEFLEAERLHKNEKVIGDWRTW